MPNILRSIFLQKLWKHEAGRLVPDFFLLFEKTLHMAKVVSILVLKYFDRPRLVHQMKTNFVTLQTVDLKIWSVLIFYKKGLALASPPHFVYDVSKKKKVLMLYSINWPNFIAWLLLLLDILGNMCIVIICCPVRDTINFEINLSFLIKLFLHIIKKSGQKPQERQELLTWNKKHLLIIFKAFSWKQI